MALGQPKGLLCCNDDLAHWLLNFERYGGSDRASYLQANGGKYYRKDRVKHPEPIKIRHLSVAMFGTIQPDRLSVVLKGADDGLVGWFPFSWPDRLPFRRPCRSANVQAASDVLCLLSDLTMSKDQEGNPAPVHIPLSGATRDLLEGFIRRLSDREDAAHGLLKGSIGKRTGAVR
jgi:hypothetical protein